MTITRARADRSNSKGLVPIRAEPEHLDDQVTLGVLFCIHTNRVPHLDEIVSENSLAPGYRDRITR
jgi:hypothetical protein